MKSTREQRGISLQSVHEGTKIPLDVLKAIEEGYKIRTLAPFYYKGFLKMYAQYLGVDLSQIKEELPDQYLETEKKIEAPRKEQSVGGSGGTGAPIAQLSVKKYRKNFTIPKPDLLIRGAIGFVAVLLLLKFVFFLVSKIPFRKSNTVKVEKNIRREAQKAKKESAAAESKEKILKSVVPPAAVGTSPIPIAAPKIVEQPKAPAPSAAVPAVTPAVAVPVPMGIVAKTHKKILLTVKAKKNTWLQVREDGVVVFQSILKKGMAEAWNANDSIEISGKSIYQLEFELNGKLLGSLGREDRAAKKVIVTKDGLSVKK